MREAQVRGKGTHEGDDERGDGVRRGGAEDALHDGAVDYCRACGGEAGSVGLHETRADRAVRAMAVRAFHGAEGHGGWNGRGGPRGDRLVFANVFCDGIGVSEKEETSQSSSLSVESGVPLVPINRL